MIVTREQRRKLARDNQKFPTHLVEVTPDKWPEYVPDRLVKVFRSRDFLVQVFDCDGPVLVRLTIGRTMHNGEGWLDGILWEDLQRLKGEAGYRSYDAVEVFPSSEDVVHVANMRHLWVMRDKIPFAWRHSGAVA